MPTILNQETLASLRELGDDFFKELIETFLESSRDQMELIRRGVQERNGAGIEAAAHSLKGACYGQGAEELGILCKEVEARGRENNLAEIDDLMARIAKSYQLTTATLRELL